MPRIGLPAKPSKPKSSGGGSSSSVSAAAQLRVALGATAFRAVSALVASFAAVLFARSTPAAERSTFGLYPILTHLVDQGHTRARTRQSARGLRFDPHSFEGGGL